MRNANWLALAAVIVPISASKAEEGKDPAEARAEAARWIEVLKKEPAKRKFGALELGRIGPPAGVAIQVLAALTGDKDDAVRGNAVWALGKIAGPRYEPVVLPFTEAYKAKYFPPTEDWTANGDPLAKHALPALKKALGDKTGDVRVNAVFALGCMEERAADAAPLLARALLKDDDERVRRNAAWALTKVPGTAKAVLPALQEATKSASPFIRRTACIAMAWFGKDAAAALPDLLKVLDAENRGPVGAAMNYFEVIAGMGESAAAAVPGVAKFLDSKFPLEAASAAWCIGKVRAGAVACVPKFTELLRSPDADLRRNVAWALGRIGPDAKAAAAELRRLSEGDPDAAVKANALQALSIISGLPVPTGSDVPEPKGAGADGAITVSSGDTIEVLK